jgi:hypothetical protein
MENTGNHEKIALKRKLPEQGGFNDYRGPSFLAVV